MSAAGGVAYTRAQSTEALTVNKRVHLEVVDVGANRPDCRHAEHTAIVWHAGPGGPLLEYECRLCGRRIRERIDPKESLWPAQDFVL